MLRTVTLGLLVAASLAACDRGGGAAETASAAPPPPAAAAPPEDGDLLAANDRAIAENKRVVATLARYQQQDFGKYQRLRTACEAQAHGTLADPAALAVAHCIEAGW